MGKFNVEDLVCELPAEHTFHGDICPSPQAYFRGETYLKGAKLHMGWQVLTGPLPMEETHFHHAAEEYLVFFGATLPDVFASFDAEIDVLLGEDPDDLQKITITKPTILRIPPNIWHCPIDFRIINKPILWQAIYQDGTWAKIIRRIKEDGTKEYIYEGDNVRECRLRPGLCTMCGECFHKPEAE